MIYYWRGRRGWTRGEERRGEGYYINIYIIIMVLPGLYIYKGIYMRGRDNAQRKPSKPKTL